jgi:predicted nucleic acid-binding protein
MTVYVESDFLIALVNDSDWLQAEAENALADHDVETSAFAYLEILLGRERYEFDYVPLIANLLELVPVRDDEERQIVLKAVNYYADGMTPFDAFHAATAETRERAVLSSEQDYDEIGVERLPLEPQSE